MDVYGLVGNPVGHSLSPPMHEAAYEQLGIDARYVTFEPDPADLTDAIEGADALGIAGLNVTIPFKERVVPMVEPDDLAARIGAVNTVDFGDGDPTGHNTDAYGAVRALESAGADPSGRTAVVVGAGGAGRAVTFGLVDAGARVRVANRTTERALGLAEDAGSPVTGHPLSALDGLLTEADILVNATSVGMESDRSPVPAGSLHADLTVLDAVYRPLETRLLAEARDAGARTIDGGKMLLYQGVAAFERWTGQSPPVDAMERALYDRL